jgi:hypothetical protein
MTTFLDPVAAMIAKIRTDWAADGDPLPIVVPNDDSADLNLDAGFVALIPNITSSDFASINGSNPKVRTLGILEINIHTIINTGIAEGLAYAEQISGYIRGRDISGVEMFSPTVARGYEIGYNTQGKYWLTPVMCGFRYETHQSIVD